MTLAWRLFENRGSLGSLLNELCAMENVTPELCDSNAEEFFKKVSANIQRKTQSITFDDVWREMIVHMSSDDKDVLQWLPLFWRLSFGGRPEITESRHREAVIRLGAVPNKGFDNPAVLVELKDWVENVLLKWKFDELLQLCSAAAAEDGVQCEYSAYYYIVLSRLLKSKDGDDVRGLWGNLVNELISSEVSDDENIFCAGAFDVFSHKMVAGLLTVLSKLQFEETTPGVLRALGLPASSGDTPNPEGVQCYLTSVGASLHHLVCRMTDIFTDGVGCGRALYFYGCAFDRAKDDISACSQQFSGPWRNWLEQHLHSYIHDIDLLLKVVVDRICDNNSSWNVSVSRLSGLIMRVSQCMKHAVKTLIRDQSFDPSVFDVADDEREMTEEEVVAEFAKAWEASKVNARLQNAIREVLGGRLRGMDPSVLLQGKDAVMNKLREACRVDNNSIVCEACKESWTSPKCTGCLILRLCGDAKYNEIKTYIRPQDPLQYCQVECFVKDFLKDEVRRHCNKFKKLNDSVWKEVWDLGKRLTDVDSFRREMDRILKMIPEKFEELRTPIRAQLQLFLDRLQQKRDSLGDVTYEIVGTVLVVKGWSVSVKEASERFTRGTYTGLVLVGVLEVVFDIPLLKLPGICVAICANAIVLKLKEGRGEEECIIDTSGENGANGNDGRDGKDGRDGSHGGDGETGTNGSPGMSAGHVTINAKSVIGGSVHAIANGGNGGDGGNGANGQDGLSRFGQQRIINSLYSGSYDCAVLALLSEHSIPGSGGNAGRGGAPGGGGYRGNVIVFRGLPITASADDGKMGMKGADGIPGEMGAGGKPGKASLLIQRGRWGAFALCEKELTWKHGYVYNSSKERVLGVPSNDIEEIEEGLYRTGKINSCGFSSCDSPGEDYVVIKGEVNKRPSFSGNFVGRASQASFAARRAAIDMNAVATAVPSVRDLLPGLNEMANSLQSNTSEHALAAGAAMDNVIDCCESVPNAMDRLSVHEIIGVSTETHVQSLSRYGRQKTRCWPRISSSAIFGEIREMEFVMKYMERIEGNSGVLEVDLARYCEQWTTETLSNGKAHLSAYVVHVYSEFMIVAAAKMANMEVSELLLLYAKMRGDGIVALRQECYRALAVQHATNANTSWVEFCELEGLVPTRMLCDQRQACERLGTCAPSAFYELIRAAGACALCPERVLCALCSGWKQAFERHNCNVEQLVRGTFGKHTSSMDPRNAVEKFCGDVVAAMRMSPLDDVWAMEEFPSLCEWMRLFNERAAERVSEAVVAVFTSDEGFGNDRGLSVHDVHNKALRLLLTWAPKLADIQEMDGESNFTFYCAAVVRLARLDERPVDSLSAEERELWCAAMNFWIDKYGTGQRGREEVLRRELDPRAEGNTVAAYVFSYLNTVGRLTEAKYIVEKLNTSGRFEFLETCFCRAIAAVQSESEVAARWCEFLFRPQSHTIPFEACEMCEKQLNKVLPEMFKQVKKISGDERKNIAACLGSDDVLGSLEEFSRCVKQRFVAVRKVSGLWLSSRYLLAVHMRQKAQLLCAQYRKWVVPPECSALLEMPPESLSLHVVSLISEKLLPMLFPIQIPDVSAGPSEATGASVTTTTAGDNTSSGNNEISELLKKARPLDRHILEKLRTLFDAEHERNMLSLLKRFPAEEWVRRVGMQVLCMYLNLWSPGFLEGDRAKKVLDNFGMYCSERLLLWFLFFVMKEYTQFACAPRESAESEEAYEQKMRDRTTAEDLMLIMEALDGMWLGMDHVSPGHTARSLVEYVSELQQSKFDQVYALWVEPIVAEDRSRNRALMEELRGWMLDVDEPKYSEFLQLMRSLTRGDVAPDGPLRSLLQVDAFTVSSEEKLSTALKSESHEWTEIADKWRATHEARLRNCQVRDWGDLRQSGKFREDMLSIAEEIGRRLNEGIVDGKTLKKFREEYKRHTKDYGDAVEHERNILRDRNRMIDVLFVICSLLMRKKEIQSLHPVQLLAIVTISHGSTLLNVETGEGKTYISGCLMAFKAFCGYMVDVVTSSAPLAMQSEENLRPFFEELFGEKMSAILTACTDEYESPIVFGTLTQYVTSSLTQERCSKGNCNALDKRNSRKRYLLLDEADQPMLNDFAHVVYLGSEWLPGRRVTPGLLAILQSFLTAEGGDITESAREGARRAFSDTVGEMTTTANDPALSPARLERYLDSAMAALKRMRADCEYVVLENKPVPFNPETGELQHGMSWQDGLSTMIAMQNGTMWSEEALAPVFRSFFSFLVSYRGRIGGLAGTVGCWRSRRVLEVEYGLRVVAIPRAFARHFKFEPPTVKPTCYGRDRAVAELALKKVSAGHPVLIITRYQLEAKKMADILRPKRPEGRVVLYLEGNKPQLKEEYPVIIVATAIAGRGMDLTIPDSQKEKGLFVILTYCATPRETVQVYGRAARQCDVGGGTSIVEDPSGCYSEAQNNAILSEKRRLERIHGTDAGRILLEDMIRRVFVSGLKKLFHELEYKICCSEENEELSSKVKEKLLGVVEDIATERFGRWLSDNDEAMDAACVSLESSERLVKKMHEDVLKPLEEWRETPIVLKLFESPEEVIRFVLALKDHYGLLSELRDKSDDSVLAKAEKECSFGAVPYYLAYSYLCRARDNRSERLFERARACLSIAATRFGVWEDTYKKMEQNMSKICQTGGDTDGLLAIKDHALVMEHHRNIIRNFCGTGRWDPEMFVDVGFDASSSKEIFILLLKKELLKPASLAPNFKDRVLKSPRLCEIEQFCDVDDLCTRLSEAGGRDTDYGVGLFDATQCAASANKTATGSENGHLRLWALLTGEDCGAVTPFAASTDLLSLSDDDVKEKIDDSLMNTRFYSEGDVLKVSSCFCYLLGRLRSGNFDSFSVSLPPLDEAIRKSEHSGKITVPQWPCFFECVGLDRAIVIGGEKSTLEKSWDWIKSHKKPWDFTGVSLLMGSVTPTILLFPAWLLGSLSGMLSDILRHLLSIPWNQDIWKYILSTVASTALGALCSSILFSQRMMGLYSRVRNAAKNVAGKAGNLLNRVRSGVGTFVSMVTRVREKIREAHEWLRSTSAFMWLKQKHFSEVTPEETVFNTAVRLGKQMVTNEAKRLLSCEARDRIPGFLGRYFMDMQRELLDVYLCSPLKEMCAKVRRESSPENYSKFLAGVKDSDFVCFLSCMEGSFRTLRDCTAMFLEKTGFRGLDKVFSLLIADDVSFELLCRKFIKPQVKEKCQVFLAKLKESDCVRGVLWDTPINESLDSCDVVIAGLRDSILKEISDRLSGTMSSFTKLIFASLGKHQRARDAKRITERMRRPTQQESENAQQGCKGSSLLINPFDEWDAVQSSLSNRYTSNNGYKGERTYLETLKKIKSTAPTTAHCELIGQEKRLHVYLNDNNPDCLLPTSLESIKKEILKMGSERDAEAKLRIIFHTHGSLSRESAHQLQRSLGGDLAVEVRPLRDTMRGMARDPKFMCAAFYSSPITRCYEGLGGCEPRPLSSFQYSSGGARGFFESCKFLHTNGRVYAAVQSWLAAFQSLLDEFERRQAEEKKKITSDTINQTESAVNTPESVATSEGGLHPTRDLSESEVNISGDVGQNEVNNVLSDTGPAEIIDRIERDGLNIRRSVSNLRQEEYTADRFERCCMLLSDAVYYPDGLKRLPSGVTKVDMSDESDFVEKKDNMKCVVYVMGVPGANQVKQTYIVVFKGTKIGNLQEWKENLNSLLMEESTETHKIVVSNARIVVRRFGRENVVFSGHSKGGREAFIAAVATGGRAIIFNPALPHCDEVRRIKDKLPSDMKSSRSDVKSFVVFNEILSLVQEEIMQELERPDEKVIVYLEENEGQNIFEYHLNSENFSLLTERHMMDAMIEGFSMGSCVKWITTS